MPQRNQKRLFDVEMVEALVAENERLFDIVRSAAITIDEHRAGRCVDFDSLMGVLRRALQDHEVSSAPLEKQAVHRDGLDELAAPVL